MRGKKTLADAQKALEDANIAIFAVSSWRKQLYLSACLNVDLGRWLLAAVEGGLHESLDCLF